MRIQKDRIATQLRDQNIDCIYRDPNGIIWIATWRSIFRLSRQDALDSKRGGLTYNYLGAMPVGKGMVLRQLDLPKAGAIAISEQSRVKAITRDQLGRLWISMESGTFRLERSSWTSLESLGGPQGTATAEFTDSEGRVWFGFSTAFKLLIRRQVKIGAGKGADPMTATVSGF